MRHLKRREGMDVDRGRRRAHRAKHVQIGVAVIVGMNAALQADLGRTPISGLRVAPPHLLENEHIGWYATVLRRPLRTGARSDERSGGNWCGIQCKSRWA